MLDQREEHLIDAGIPSQAKSQRVRVGAASARDLRQRSTPAEAALWRALRDRRLGGLKFRRQRLFGPNVVDFCCVDARLIVEVDGAVHDRQADQDAERTRFLEAHGFRVLRLPNSRVLEDLDSALALIQAASDPNHSPPPRYP